MDEKDSDLMRARGGEVCFIREWELQKTSYKYIWYEAIGLNGFLHTVRGKLCFILFSIAHSLAIQYVFHIRASLSPKSKEFLMHSSFSNTSLISVEDLIGIGNRTQTIGDNQYCLSFDEVWESL